MFFLKISDPLSVLLLDNQKFIKIAGIAEISNYSFLLYGLQVVMLPIQIAHYFVKKKDVTRLRYLGLAIAFLLFNSLVFLSTYFFEVAPVFSVHAIPYFCFFIASFVYYYLIAELNISVGKYSALHLLLSLLLVQFLKEIAVFNLFQADTYFIELAFSLIFCLVSALFSINVIRLIYQRTNRLLHTLFFTAIGVFVLGAFFPLILFFVDSSYTNIVIVNAVFAMISAAYLWHYVLELRSKNMAQLSNPEYTRLPLNDRYLKIPFTLSSFDFTPREQEIASLILQGSNYHEIAIKLFISETTVRVHASNIFSKVGVNGDKKIKQFRESYGKNAH